MRHPIESVADSLGSALRRWRLSVQQHDQFYDEHFDDIVAETRELCSKLDKMRDEMNEHLSNLATYRITTNQEADRLLQLALELGAFGEAKDVPASIAGNVARYLREGPFYAP